jgi:hypothetical protein
MQAVDTDRNRGFDLNRRYEPSNFKLEQGTLNYSEELGKYSQIHTSRFSKIPMEKPMGMLLVWMC